LSEIAKSVPFVEFTKGESGTSFLLEAGGSMNPEEDRMKLANQLLTRRHVTSGMITGALLLTMSAGTAFSQDASEVRIGFTPKFLKDDFQNLMANGANVIVFAPLDSAGIVPAVKKANETNVLVFSIDDAPAGGIVSATVRADNVDAGAQGAKEMAKRLQEKACWKDDSCIVLELQGALTTPNGLDRSDGFAKTLAELAPKVTLIQRPTEWTADMAADAAQNVLTQNPNLTGIFMASELMASAVNAQLAAGGKGATVGDPASVIRVAIDGTPQGLQLIRDKALDATVSQPLSAYATKTAELIELFTKGGKLEAGPREDGKVVDTPVGPQYQLNATLVTAENVDSPDLWANQLGK
jgi:ribose transport system substrate-binding protein